MKQTIAKRLLCPALALALALALVGCKPSDGAPQSSTAGETPSSESPTATPSDESRSAEPSDGTEPVTELVPPENVEGSKLTWADFTFTFNNKEYASYLKPDGFSAADGWVEQTQIDYGEAVYPRDYLLSPGEDGYLAISHKDSDVKVMLYYENVYSDETRLIDCPCYSANFYGEKGQGFSFARGVTFGASENEIVSAFGEPDQKQSLALEQPTEILLYQYGICALVFVVRENALITAQYVYG